MIDLPLKRLKPGMVTSQSIYNSSGANYLTRGSELTQQYIDKLRNLGVANLHVMSTSVDKKIVPPEDVLSEKTRAMAVKRVYDVFQQVGQNGTFEVEPLSKAAEAMVNDVVDRRGNLVQLTDIRVHDMYTFAHSVNVAMISALIGVLAGLTPNQLQELTLGALLHDLGKIVVPPEILNKPGRLTKNEFDIIRHHPVAGHEKIMRMKIPNCEKLSIVALQHHEHLDGTGYPNGLAGDSLHLYGRISAIADVYDALTSSRPYKKAYSPAIAYNIMVNCSQGHFDGKLLDFFFSNVAVYPVGTVVRTSEGFGIVKSVEFGKTSRPVIIIFADKQGKIVSSPREIDLFNNRNVQIDIVMNDEDLFNFIHSTNYDPATLLAS